MRLITWNCQGAFRKKANVILNYRPDILVVQECEKADKLVFNSLGQRLNDFYWSGSNIHTHNFPPVLSYILHQHRVGSTQAIFVGPFSCIERRAILLLL